MSTINPTDPVSLGLCTQMDLDRVVKVAAEKKAKADAKAGKDVSEGLKPVVDEAIPTEAPKTEHTLESLFKPSSAS